MIKLEFLNFAPFGLPYPEAYFCRGYFRVSCVWWLTCVTSSKIDFEKGFTVAQKCHGNFNLLTAVSICSRQFQFAHGSFNYTHGNFTLLTAISTLLTALQVHRELVHFSAQCSWKHHNFHKTCIYSDL